MMLIIMMMVLHMIVKVAIILVGNVKPAILLLIVLTAELIQ